MRNLNLYLLISVLLIISAISTSSQIPQKYQGIYNELNNKLLEINDKLDKSNPNEQYPTNFAAQLTVADANRGEILLEPKTQYGVIAVLDAIKEINIKAVKISINYPILVNNFQKSKEYLSFFKNVFNEIRKRDLKILVQTTPCFRDTLFGGLNVNDFYQGLNWNRYKQEKLQMIQTIIDSLSPDYLTIENEPSTAQMNTGLDFSIENYVNEIKYFLSGLNRKKVMIGAGMGTWEKIENANRLIKETDLDYFDMHVYPINLNLFNDLAFKIDSITKTFKKKLIIGEAWLYKLSDKELASGNLSYIDIYSRDVYKFWNPLDSSFTEALVKFANYSKSELLSFYWVQYFFSKLDYSDNIDNMPPANRYLLGSQSASQNILIKNPDYLGVLYRDLINRYFKTTEVIDIFDNHSLGLYPNPATDFLNISGFEGEVEIFNTMGTVLWKGNISFGQKIDILNFENGIYLLRTNYSNHKFMVFR